MARNRGGSRTALILLMAGNLVLFALYLMLRGGEPYSPLLDGWIGNLTMLVPTAACFARVVVGGPRRGAALWLGLGMLSWTAGNVIYVTTTQFQTSPPVPSPADLAYLGFYVCVAASLVCLVRSDLGAFARSLWLGEPMAIPVHRLENGALRADSAVPTVDLPAPIIPMSNTRGPGVIADPRR